LAGEWREEAALKVERDDRPISWPLGILCFLFACGCFTIIIPILYQKAGRWKAAEQAWSCFGFGILTMLALGVAAVCLAR